jgi:protein TonB
MEAKPEPEPAAVRAPVEAAPRPAAAPPAAAPPDPVKASARILSELSRRIGDRLSYPVAARRRGLEGTLVAEFSVDARGGLVSARVAVSSGSDILDAAGLELLRGVFPVENDSGKRLDLRIAIGYKLSSSP